MRSSEYRFCPTATDWSESPLQQSYLKDVSRHDTHPLLSHIMTGPKHLLSLLGRPGARPGLDPALLFPMLYPELNDSSQSRLRRRKYSPGSV
jgi:hypothetical protein